LTGPTPGTVHSGRSSPLRRPPAPSPKRDTVEGFFDAWIKMLGTPKVRRATARQYRSSIRKHVIPTLEEATQRKWRKRQRMKA
jgi:hypothetical protein